MKLFIVAVVVATLIVVAQAAPNHGKGHEHGSHKGDQGGDHGSRGSGQGGDHGSRGSGQGGGRGGRGGSGQDDSTRQGGLVDVAAPGTDILGSDGKGVDASSALSGLDLNAILGILGLAGGR